MLSVRVSGVKVFVALSSVRCAVANCCAYSEELCARGLNSARSFLSVRSLLLLTQRCRLLQVVVVVVIVAALVALAN